MFKHIIVCKIIQNFKFKLYYNVIVYKIKNKKLKVK